MTIDNFTRDYRTGNITSSIEGYTFTHSPQCRLHQHRGMGIVDFATACDCYLSRIKVRTLPGGDQFPSVDAERVDFLLDRNKDLSDRLAGALRRNAFLTVVGTLGWLYGLARGLGWF